MDPIKNRFKKKYREVQNLDISKQAKLEKINHMIKKYKIHAFRN